MLKILMITILFSGCGAVERKLTNVTTKKIGQALDGIQAASDRRLSAILTEEIKTAFEVSQIFNSYNLSKYGSSHILSGREADELLTQMLEASDKPDAALRSPLYTYQEMDLIYKDPGSTVFDYMSYWVAKMPSVRLQANAITLKIDSVKSKPARLITTKQASLMRLIATDVAIAKSLDNSTGIMQDLLKSQEAVDIMRHMNLDEM